MYVGVNDKAHIVEALDHGACDKIMLMARRLVSQKVQPKIKYEISAIPSPDSSPIRYVLKIEVEKSKALPVMLSENRLFGVYVRSCGSTVSASSEEIRDMVLLSDEVSFDDQLTDEQYDAAKYSDPSRIYEERTGSPLTEKLLISMGFMSSGGKLSRDALLFEDGYSGMKTKITATSWPGTTKGSSVILASEEHSGNILSSIDFAMKFIQSHSINGFKKEATKRVPLFSYPARSITGSVVNAIAHRNYFITGSQIEINLFRDRLEITSPGALLGVKEMKKETNISSIIPRRRNEVICRVLERCRYMESKGSGFDKISDDYKAYGDEYRPYISSDSSSFTMTLPNLLFKGGVVNEDSIPEVFTDRKLSRKNDREILSICYAKARAAGEIAKRVKVADSTYFRQKVLDRLVGEGFLLKKTSGRTSTYLSNQDEVFLAP